MHTRAQFKPASRRGITLLEVLMAMFVLAIGILSIFGLFTAGRELEARAAIKSDAIAYAATLRTTITDQWIKNWRDWLYVHTGTNFASVGANLAAPQRVSLPVLIDPCGLNTDTQPRSQFLRLPASDWDWARMTPLNSGTTSLQPFARVTLPLTAAGFTPMSREGAVASVSDQDSIEYTLPPNDNDPPLNAFELGRRKRGSDLIPALFVAATSAASLPNTLVNAGVQVTPTLLIFHKPGVDMETPVPPAAGDWPAGYLELQVTAPQQSGLLDASLTRVPSDSAVIRRSLRPGNWLLIAEPRGSVTSQWFDTRWVKIKSATNNSSISPNGWLFVLDEDRSTANLSRCYAFERLVHVVDDLDPVTLPP